MKLWRDYEKAGAVYRRAGARFKTGVLACVEVKHLRIAIALARFAWRAAPAGWYRRPPFLPLPPAAYLRWRMRTAYGGAQPGPRLILSDIWQFGGWLAAMDRSMDEMKRAHRQQ